MLPRKNFKISDSQISGNALNFLFFQSSHYFVSFQIFYNPIKRAFLALGGVLLLLLMLN